MSDKSKIEWTSQPWDGGMRLKLASAKGGDPSEWPVDIRVREYPSTIPAETSQAA